MWPILERCFIKGLSLLPDLAATAQRAYRLDSFLVHHGIRARGDGGGYGGAGGGGDGDCNSGLRWSWGERGCAAGGAVLRGSGLEECLLVL